MSVNNVVKNYIVFVLRMFDVLFKLYAELFLKRFVMKELSITVEKLNKEIDLES